MHKDLSLSPCKRDQTWGRDRRLCGLSAQLAYLGKPRPVRGSVSLRGVWGQLRGLSRYRHLLLSLTPYHMVGEN